MIHVVLAALNEEAALGEVIRGIGRCLADGDVRVVVVDDGSTDGTARVAEDPALGVPVTVLRHDRNRGLGAALRTGFDYVLTEASSLDVVVTLDADNTHPPALIPRLAAAVADGEADVAIASRFVPGARVVGVPLHRRLLSRAAEAVFRLLLPLAGVRDYTCGFRAYRAGLLRDLGSSAPLPSETGFAAQAEILVRAGRRGARCREIPLVLRYDRKTGVSRLRVGHTVVRTLRLVFRLRRNIT